MRPSKYSASTDTSAMILSTLMNSKTCAQYDLPKAIDMDYRTVLRHLKLLEFYGMIRLVEKKPAKTGGMDRKIFGLTANGLLQALRYKYAHEGITLEMLDGIVDTHADLLPLIFGKWGLFRKHRVRRLIFDRFANALYHLPDRLEEMSEEIMSKFERKSRELKELSQPPSERGKLNYGEKRMVEVVVSAVPDILKGEQMGDESSVNFNVFFERPQLGLVESQLKLFSVLKKDKDLEAYVNETFERVEGEYQGYLQNIESWKRDWISS